MHLLKSNLRQKAVPFQIGERLYSWNGPTVACQRVALKKDLQSRGCTCFEIGFLKEWIDLDWQCT